MRHAAHSDTDSIAGFTNARHPRRAVALVECERFDEAFVFWHARYADDQAGALAALAALSVRAARDWQHQLAARYDAMHCALRRGSRWYPLRADDRALPLHDAVFTGHRLRHDAAQLEYLHALGALGDEFPAIVARYRQLAARLDAGQPSQRELISAGEQDAIDDAYDRIIHVRPTPCVTQPLSGHARAALRQLSVRALARDMLVIDHFLTDVALNELWRFCLQSTVWFHDGGQGRLGARYQQGFNCPLLVQVARLIQGLLGDRYPLLRLRACKHPPRAPEPALRGAAMHDEAMHGAAMNGAAMNGAIMHDAAMRGAAMQGAAKHVEVMHSMAMHNAAMNGAIMHDAAMHGTAIRGAAMEPDRAVIDVQLWLTPDAANRDRASGGMVLRDARGVTRYVPYRQNRAIIFAPAWPHGASAGVFRDDYASSRIDVMLRYGYSTPSLRSVAMSSSP